MPVSATITTDIVSPDRSDYTVDFDMTSVLPVLWSIQPRDDSTGSGSLRDSSREISDIAYFGYGTYFSSLVRSIKYTPESSPYVFIGGSGGNNGAILHRNVSSVHYIPGVGITDGYLVWPSDTYTMTVNYLVDAQYPPRGRDYYPVSVSALSFLTPRFAVPIKGLALSRGWSAGLVRDVSKVSQEPWVYPLDQSLAIWDSAHTGSTSGDAGDTQNKLVFFDREFSFVNGIRYEDASRASLYFNYLSLNSLVWGTPPVGELGIHVPTASAPGTVTANINWYDKNATLISTSTLGPYSLIQYQSLPNYYGLAMMLPAFPTPPTNARFFTMAPITGTGSGSGNTIAKYYVRCKWGSVRTFPGDYSVPPGTDNYPTPVVHRSFEDPNEWNPGIQVDLST